MREELTATRFPLAVACVVAAGAAAALLRDFCAYGHEMVELLQLCDKELTSNETSPPIGAATVVPARDATKGRMTSSLNIVKRGECTALEAKQRTGKKERTEEGKRNKRPQVD
jgi:hypothetical protein